MHDYYQILDLSNKSNQTLTPADLRQAYKQALLYFHPDKQAQNSTLQSKAGGTIPTIDEITQAYKTLSDPELRAEYDRQRQRNDGGREDDGMNTHHTGMETVDLEELEFDEAAESWSRECRCGSQPAFVVTEPELERNVEYGELITGCKGCSLWLKVLFSVEE